MEEKLKLVSEYIDAHRDEIIADWKTVVNIESHTPDLEGVRAVAEKFKELFEGAGVDCQIAETGMCPSLVGIIGADRPGKPIIFSGHYDTVFKKGTFGDDPFRIEDGRAYGPGCLDMKGGIVIALYVIKALNSIGYEDTPIKIIFSGDEENAHDKSTGGDVIFEAAKGGLFAFNMETGNPRNALVVARKGCLRGYITITGVEAHAGNDFFAGRNAILEAAYKAVEIAKLTDLKTESTMNLGTIQGGTMPNCVAGSCSMVLDMRFWTAAEKDRMVDGVNQIVAKNFVDGTTATVEYKSYMPAFENTEGVRRFYAHVGKVAEKYGFDPIDEMRPGGASDASYITMAGTPVLCSFGVQVEWNHTTREYAIVESLFTRAKFISAVILENKAF